MQHGRYLAEFLSKPRPKTTASQTQTSDAQQNPKRQPSFPSNSPRLRANRIEEIPDESLAPDVSLPDRSTLRMHQSPSEDKSPSEDEDGNEEAFRLIMDAVNNGDEEYAVGALWMLAGGDMFGGHLGEDDYFEKLSEAAESGQSFVDAGLWPGESDSDGGGSEGDEMDQDAQAAKNRAFGRISQALC